MVIENVNGIEELNSFLRSPDKQKGTHLALFQLGNSQSLLQVDRDINLVSYIDKFDRPMMPNIRSVILAALPQTTQILDVSRDKRRENIYDPDGFSASSNLNPQDPHWQEKAIQILAAAAVQQVAAVAAAAPTKATTRPGLRFWQREKAAAVAPAPDNAVDNTHKPSK
jgi:hypothetical protein